MKKRLIFYLMLTLCPLQLLAQSSSMTDDQVMDLIVNEHSRGTSNAQIVTRLMQSGVNISQIRRVKEKYERQTKGGGLGTITDDKQANGSNRLRQLNGDRAGQADADNRRDEATRRANTTRRIQDNREWRNSYDENSEDFLSMQNELEGILPTDTAELVKQLQDELQRNRKRVFGRDIFNNKDLTFEPAMNIATPQNYTLGPGDVVSIDIYGASQKSGNYTVSPDGDIVIDGFGPVHVGGLNVEQTKARLRSTLGTRYQSSRIKLSLGQTRTISINVMGEVKAPGTYTISAFGTVFHALYMAGGTNDLGTLRNIKVYRNNKLISTCDIYDYILNGKMTGNVRLTDGDVIVVGPYDCLVNIAGKVKRPMYYEMKPTESVGTLLKYAGGFTGDAYKKSVRVMRKTGRERAVFNVEEFDMNSFHVADGDSVSVDSILPRYENTVEVKGAVFRPGMYQIGSGISSVRTLIEHAEGLTENALQSRGIIHRMKADRTLEVVSFDVAAVMSGRAADIPLKENDVVFIPDQSEKMDTRTISIHGEVQYPGVYQYADNETLEDFVLQAGGLTDQASTAKVDVARRVSDSNALSTDSLIAHTYSFSLKEGFVVDGQPGFILMPFDEVYVRKSPAYSKQQNVTVSGEAMFPGTYTLNRRNMRLTDLVKAAGGVTAMAYVKGARLERVPTQAERDRMQAAFKMQQEQLQQQLLQLAASSNSSNVQQLSQQNIATQLQKFQVPATYPVGIELDKALKDPKSDANIILREGDRLILPQFTATVKINGAVMYPNTVAYERGKRAKYYINNAGGFSQNARKGSAYIIYMNGMVGKVGQGAKIEPGCEIVVPSKLTRKMTTAETMTLGTGIASIATMIATIANLTK